MRDYAGASALMLCSEINDLTIPFIEILDESSVHQSGVTIKGRTCRELTEYIQRIHWLSHELECRLGGHGGIEHATGPLLLERIDDINEH